LVRFRLAAVIFVVGAISIACGAAATTPPPTAPPTPTPTPNPHLTEPASIDRVYSELRKAGLTIAANTAESGTEPAKTLNLTYASWPLILEQYSSAAALVKATGFDPTKKPAFGDAPYRFAGLNIYVEFGPHVQNGEPARPDYRAITAAEKLVDALDVLIGPLQQSSVSPIALPAASASPSPSPSPTPTKKPKPTKKPRPTKKP
jgi:hypothetical protein